MPDAKITWNINKPDKEKVTTLMNETGISGLLAVVMANRGYNDSEAVEKFLNPKLNNLHSPLLLKDMEKAAARIRKEIEKQGKILIYGDYDADGVTSTAVLYDYLKNAGANVEYYIPDRFSDGYGLNMNTAGEICSRQPSLVITVDNGISAVEEIKYITNHGIDVVITDHHECPDILPSAFAIINPKQPDCKYPFKFLAGVGVVFKLVQTLCKTIDGYGRFALKYIDLVCIGTIADIVPLIDENRILVKYGLEAMVKTKNYGLKALYNEAGIKEINTWAVSFGIAPRVNAAGRLGGAQRAVELFTAGDEYKAAEIAKELNHENTNRQEIETMLVEEIQEKITAESLEKDNIIIVSGENWHHGVLGIAASRIVEKYYKPCILISFEGDIGRGSGRSIEGCSLFNILSDCGQFLERFGGHQLAGGLTIQKNFLEKFKKTAIELADSIIGQAEFSRILNIEAEITPNELSSEAVSGLKLIEPYGAGNPTPLFFMDKLKISEIRTVGENKHIKMRLNHQGIIFDAIGFKMGELINKIKAGDLVQIVFSPEINQYRGQKSVQLNIKDIKLSTF